MNFVRYFRVFSMPKIKTKNPTLTQTFKNLKVSAQYQVLKMQENLCRVLILSKVFHLSQMDWFFFWSWTELYTYLSWEAAAELVEFPLTWSFIVLPVAVSALFGSVTTFYVCTISCFTYLTLILSSLYRGKSNIFLSGMLTTLIPSEASMIISGSSIPAVALYKVLNIKNMREKHDQIQCGRCWWPVINCKLD